MTILKSSNSIGFKPSSIILIDFFYVAEPESKIRFQLIFSILNNWLQIKFQFRNKQTGINGAKICRQKIQRMKFHLKLRNSLQNFLFWFFEIKTNPKKHI